ncbi:MAG: hypothetical protein HC849_04425 [Oscillatoriales cyanobacterium RU_3_3]|nr:hypothetical protein [Microcoleus sp. SU_5_3]NJM59605.1 hypothetical protein [Oscillatoriales cyanobacterium RU_3_3]
MNIVDGTIEPMSKKDLIIWFVNHSFVKNDQPVTRSISKFYKAVRVSLNRLKIVDDSWLKASAKIVVRLGWATSEFTPVDK